MSYSNTDAPRLPAAVARPRRRPRRNSAESREQILRAATSEFVMHGFAGARINRIVKKASSNPRMIYHYFGSKSELYLAVLEEALGGLRRRELQIDIEHLEPREGLLQLFDFMSNYFESNQHLVRLLSAENLLKAKYMRKSRRIPEMSSPVLHMIEHLISRGTEVGQLPKELDALRLYVLMVALSQFHLSNGHTLSTIFGRDLYDPSWRAARAGDARRMIAKFLTGMD
jgi:AcrR family transcriptional regulator